MPATVTSPAVGRSSPASRCSSVVLPLPERPTSAVSAPAVELAAQIVEDDPRAVALADRAQLGHDGIASGARSGRRRLLRRALRRRPPAAGRSARRRASAATSPGLPASRSSGLGQAHPAVGDHERPRPARPRLLDDPAVADDDDPVGDRRGRRVVADDQRRAARLAHELAEHPVDQRGVLGVELAGRLVCEQQPRPVRNGGAHRDALLLAARQRQPAGRRRGRRCRPARAAPAPPSCSRRARGRAARAAARPSAGTSGRARASGRSAGRAARGCRARKAAAAVEPMRPSSVPSTWAVPADRSSSPRARASASTSPIRSGRRRRRSRRASTVSVRPCSATVPLPPES